MVTALVVAVLSGASTSAWAEDSLPIFDGVMSFPAIQGSSDAEEFSWEVQLPEGQELEQVDSQHAIVYYTEGHVTAFEITVTPAHDASGATVPTSLAVSEGNVLTLTVHHRAGNPLADGAPFNYPVLPGEGWVVIDEGVVIVNPPDESIDEVSGRVAQANPGGVTGRPSGSSQCRVPGLTGRSLAGARKRLRSANCKVGRVSRRRSAEGAPGRVVNQSPKAGTVLAARAKVDLTLARG